MSLMIKCNKCGDYLDDHGGLVFAPPNTKSNDSSRWSRVEKYHVCENCWPELEKWLSEPRTRNKMNEYSDLIGKLRANKSLFGEDSVQTRCVQDDLEGLFEGMSDDEKAEVDREFPEGI